jgi:hypothetical protein
MNPNTLDESVLYFMNGWDSAVTARSAFAIFGVLILILTIRVLWKRDCTFLAATLWLLVGAVSVVFSIIPQPIVDFVSATEYFARIRVIMGGISLLVLLTTLESIRRTKLQERYALLWVVTGLAIFLCAIFPRAVNLFRAVTGMQYVTAVVAVAFTFLVLVAFNFSIAMSAMECDRDKIAQKVAILEARLRELERKIGKDPSLHDEVGDKAAKSGKSG